MSQDSAKGSNSIPPAARVRTLQPVCVGNTLDTAAHVALCILPALQLLQVVLFIPDFIGKTSDARAVLGPNISRKEAIFSIGRVAWLINALSSGNLDNLKVTDCCAGCATAARSYSTAYAASPACLLLCVLICGKCALWAAHSAAAAAAQRPYSACSLHTHTHVLACLQTAPNSLATGCILHAA